MIYRKPTLKHCRAQTNVHNSCVPRTWRRQASSQITRSAVPGIATRFPFFANRKIRNGRTFSRRASTHALTLKANGLYIQLGKNVSISNIVYVIWVLHIDENLYIYSSSMLTISIGSLFSRFVWFQVACLPHIHTTCLIKMHMEILSDAFRNIWLMDHLLRSYHLGQLSLWKWNSSDCIVLTYWSM